MKEYNVPLMIYNENELEKWELVLNPQEFSVYWEDNGFDMSVKEAFEDGMIDNVKWTSDSSRVMIIGLFTKGI